MKKKRLKREDRRKQILKCAVRVFARSNYKSTLVADIATEAGIAEATVYKYFGKKETVFLEILERISERVVMAWEEEYRKSDDVLELIRSMDLSYYYRMVKHPDELKLHFQAISEVDNQAVADRLRKDNEYYLAFFEKILNKGIEEGTIRRDIDVATIAWIFNGIGLITTLATLLKFDEEFDENTIRKITEQIIELVRA